MSPNVLEKANELIAKTVELERLLSDRYAKLEKAAAHLMMTTLSVRYEGSNHEDLSAGRLVRAFTEQTFALHELRKIVPEGLVASRHPVDQSFLDREGEIIRLRELENSAKLGYSAVQSRLARLQAAVEREAESITLSTGAPVEGLLKALEESKT